MNLQGATLVELLLSLSLSLVIVGLLIIVYLTLIQQTEIQTSLRVLHEQAFIVLQKLKMEAQAAGFIGCPRLTENFPLANSTDYFLDSKNKIEIQSESLDSFRLIVRHRAALAVRLRAAQQQASVLELSSGLHVAPGEILLISDCRQADLFEVETVSPHQEGQTIITRKPLHYRYLQDAEIGRFESNTFFVKKTGREDETGQALFAFYEKDRRGHKAELVEGIEQLKMEHVRENKQSAIIVELKIRHKTLLKTEYGFIVLRNE